MSGLGHVFATRFLEQYPNEIEYLRVLLGHADYKMIFQHYGHLIDQHQAAFRRLEGQTNSVNVGINNNWFTVPGSSTTNEVYLPVNPANGAVFYRLVYP